jgi:predicted TIM-barrel fold metal-dependent hydrolase
MPETFRIATEEAFAVPEQFEAYSALGRSTWRSADDQLAEAIGRHPTRYAGLAALAPHDPDRAVSEMERAIRTELETERIMWAIDYPYQSTPEPVAFMDGADLSPSEREQIYAGNAERAFHIGVRKAVSA